MDKLIAAFAQQLRDALAIGRAADLPAWSGTIRNVTVSGLGGSGIGGAIVSQLTSDDAEVPVLVNNNYHLPAYIREQSLVVVSSYSGNTEETINAFQQALDRNAEIACITSGGKALALSQQHQLNHIVIPGGNPPRSMLAFSLVQQFFILKHYGIISESYISDLENAVVLIEKEEEAIRAEAKKVAAFLHKKIPVIYAEARYAAVATRFRQQLNENAKMVCWHHVLPEMNHNELVGWAGGSEELAVVILRNEDDDFRTQVRMDISQKIIGRYTSNIMEITSKGNSRVERSLYHIHLEDWVSYYLAEMKAIDAVEVDVIAYLKTELGKV